MPTEVLEVVYKSQEAKARAEELRVQLAANAKTIDELSDAFARNAAGSEGNFAKIRALKEEQGKLEASLKKTHAAAKETIDPVTRLGSSFTTFAYAANDADQFNVSVEAGIRSLGNQIPLLQTALVNVAQVGFKGFLTALTGPAGIILGLTVAASLTPKIIGLVQSFRTEDVDRFASAITQVAAQVEKLKDSDLSLAVNTFQLDVALAKQARLLAGQKAFDDLANLKSRTETQSGQDVRELVGEAPGGAKALRDRITADRIKAATASSGPLLDAEADQADAEAKARQAARDRSDALRSGDGERAGIVGVRQLEQEARASKARQDAANARSAIEKNVSGEVGSLFDDSFKGDARAQQGLAAAAAAAGQRPLAQAIAASSPAAQVQAEAGDQAERDLQAGHDRAKRARLARQAAAKKAADAQERGAKDEESYTDADQRESDKLLKDRKKVGGVDDRAAAARRRANRKAAGDADDPLVSGLYAGAGLPIEAQLNANAFGRRSGQKGAVSDEQAAEAARRRLSAGLQRSGIDRDPLHADAVAGEVVAKAQDALRQKTGQALGQVGNLQGAMLAVQQQMLNDLAQVDARTAMLWQQLNGLTRQRGAVGRTSQNRARQ